MPPGAGRSTAQGGALDLGDDVRRLHHLFPARLEVAAQVTSKAIDVLDRHADTIRRGLAYRQLWADLLARAYGPGLVQCNSVRFLASAVVVQVATQELVLNAHDPPRGAGRFFLARSVPPDQQACGDATD